jgi:uncharacterized coiled-coil protein SlyX
MTTPVEEHLAHNTAAIDDMSAQMAQQWAAIRRLEAQVERLAGLIQAIGEDGPSAPDDMPPPHY